MSFTVIKFHDLLWLFSKNPAMSVVHARRAFWIVSGVSTPSMNFCVLIELSLTSLQDIDLDVTDDAAAGKQNWVKFDDDEAANKAATTQTATQQNNNTNNIHTHADIDNNATRISPITVTTNSSSSTTSSRDVLAADTAMLPTPANRLSPATLLPAPPSRKQTSVATASIPITTATTAAIARPRSPLNGAESGSGAEVIASAPAPVQRTTITHKSDFRHYTTAPMPADVAPAVLNTESTHVNLNASVCFNTVETVPPMRTIELSTGRIREGFANGDVIVTLLPANTKWPWITPAIFRPELVPEELMAQGLTLTVEEYVNAMETLVNDYRFTVYNICYKRILVCWIALAFTVLLTLLFSGLQGVALFSLGVGWLFLNAAAISFVCG
ncbi:unnamed protein product [Ceratitis capitata]|uniref:(Mediterranean fruit fly) hypothetical protein n=1 Tax=Ceratitis capitata TaxID=7213 RepID=A0A811UCX0_CERCA|nr:unnamed protein product [Ceratitis capitata]